MLLYTSCPMCSHPRASDNAHLSDAAFGTSLCTRCLLMSDSAAAILAAKR